MANELLDHSLSVRIKESWFSSHRAITAWGTIDDVGVSVDATTTGKPARLTSYKVNFGGVIYVASTSDETMSKVIDPQFNDLHVVSDTGVHGSHYSIELPFGPLEECKDGEATYHWRASFQVHIDDGKVNGARLYSPCGG